MTTTEALRILEAMADGCHPITGEVLNLDHVLMQEEVIEALLIAVDAVQGKSLGAEVLLDEADLLEAVAFYRTQEINPTAHRVSAFLTGDKSIKDADWRQHPLFGKNERYVKAQLVEPVQAWMERNNIHPPKQTGPGELHPYFNAPNYNRLSEKAIQQLREKVTAIPLERTEGLSEYLIERRKTLPRSHEPWGEEEIRMLKIALEYTNDMAFLCDSFGRSEAAISAQAAKLF